MPSYTLRLVLAIGLIMACSGGATPPIQTLTSRTYFLQSYNRAKLPADIGILPPKGQNPGGCHILVTAGSLTLDVEQKGFSYSYDVRDACDQRLLSQPGLSGTFEQHGRELLFRVPRVDGEVRFSGSLAQDGILVGNGDEILKFGW